MLTLTLEIDTEDVSSLLFVPVCFKLAADLPKANITLYQCPLKGEGGCCRDANYHIHFFLSQTTKSYNNFKECHISSTEIYLFYEVNISP